MGFEEAESGLIPRVDVGDLLGGDIAVVESVVASIHEARVDSEDLISSEPTTGSMDGEHPGVGRHLLDAVLGEEEAGLYNGASEVVADSNNRPPEDISYAAVQRGWRCRGRVRLQLKRLLLDSKGGVVLTQNLPIEIHASKIYTRTMFEKFGEMLYEGGLYMLVKVVPRREYTTRYVKMDSREKWCKNDFVVQVNDLGDEFKCECGIFEHFGMVCSHALKEVPPKHVLERWTKDARDILPAEFLRYQKDQGPLKYSSRRHKNLHLLCLEIVKLGDSNVDAYSLAMEQLRNVKTVLEPVAAIRDGLGLPDREMAADSVGSGIGNKQHFGPAKPAHSGSQCSDSFAAPSKKRPAGRPSTSREKAP